MSAPIMQKYKCVNKVKCPKCGSPNNFIYERPYSVIWCGDCNFTIRDEGNFDINTYDAPPPNDPDLIGDIECARDWLLPGREVTQVEADACINELNDIIKLIKEGYYK